MPSCRPSSASFAVHLVLGLSLGAAPSLAAPPRRASAASALEARVTGVESLPADAEGFRLPTEVERHAFAAALAELREPRRRGGAERALAALGFHVHWLPGRGRRAHWAVVTERRKPLRGAGVVVLNLRPARDLWVEVPHGDTDTGTAVQGVRLLEALGARALLVNGAHRCASADVSPCSGTTRSCGGALRSSDMAHAMPTYFMAAREALRLQHPTAVALSLHGEGSPADDARDRVQALVSDGTDDPRPDALSVRLAGVLGPALTARGGGAYACNADSDERGGMRKLCGTTNVQGRVDNGSGNACLLEAPTASGRFLHLEQSPGLRRLELAARPQEPGPVGAALATLLPCDLPGPAPTCDRAEAASGSP